MSAFGYQPKDNVVDAIEELAEEELKRGRTPIEIVESIMDTVQCGLNQALIKLRGETIK